MRQGLHWATCLNGPIGPFPDQTRFLRTLRELLAKDSRKGIIGLRFDHFAGFSQTKLSALLGSPVLLYCANCG